jgi:hypothetical protein
MEAYPEFVPVSDADIKLAAARGSQSARCYQAAYRVRDDPAAAYRVFADSPNCPQGPLFQALCLQLGLGVAQDLPRALSMFKLYKPIVPTGPAGSEVTLLAASLHAEWSWHARHAVQLADLLHGDADRPRTIPPDNAPISFVVHAAITLLDTKADAALRALTMYRLQSLVAGDTRDAGLCKGLLLYFQKDPRAFPALLSMSLHGDAFWPVRLLLHEHFVLRCHTARLGTEHVTRPPAPMFTGATRLSAFPMEHPSAVPPAKVPAAAADSKELSAEQKRRHRAVAAALENAPLRESGGVDALVTNAKARATCRKALSGNADGDCLPTLAAALEREPDKLFLRAVRLRLHGDDD